MKRLLFSFILMMALSAATVQAQSLQWGVVAGMNATKASFKGDVLENFHSDNCTGWYIGPKVNFSLPLGLAFDGSIQYSQKRLNGEGQLGSTSVGASKTFRSIEIPINVRYNIGVGSLASVYLATGPQFGFNLGNTEWTASGIGATFKKEKMNTSWNVGAGVKLLGHVEAGVVYNIALSKYYKAAGNDDYSFKGNSWQFQVAYLF